MIPTHLTIHASHSSLCCLLFREVDKAKPSRPSCVSVSDHTSCNMKSVKIVKQLQTEEHQVNLSDFVYC
jgi:hypothetical protein